jgi:gliding motility-associated-like protein
MALPVVNTVNDQTLSAGQTTSAINFTGTGSVYQWVNTTPAIGLPANGSGNIISFAAVNTTNSPLMAVITVTPASATCRGAAITFRITVNPAPVIMANSNLNPASFEFGSLPSSQSFTVSGTNLTSGINVTAPTSFELSQNNSSYTAALTIGAAGNVNNTIVYFRLKPGLDVNTYAGNIGLSSAGATNVNVALPNYMVTPAPLTVTADDVIKQYGETLQSNLASAAFKITSGSLKNNNTLASVAINYGAGAESTAAVGTYPNISSMITSGGNGFATANYAITPVNGTITVLPAILTITAHNKTKIYKAPNPTLTISYDGFVNNENADVLITKPGIATFAQRESSPGDYVISATGASAKNYTINYIDGVLTITPAPVEIVASNAFTPNGDGINDLWEIPALAAYPDCLVKIYARSGNLVFRSVGYSTPWDGNYGNKLLPAGAYYYIIEPGNKHKILSGSLTLIR